MKKVIFGLCLYVLCSVATASAAGSGDEHGAQPIMIKSNELQADMKSRTATFLGRVVAKQGDITIHAEKLIVRYADRGGEVEKVEAFGNVRIVQENRIGTGQQAVYYRSEGKITLSGSPKVVQGKDTITGREITYFVNEEKSIVTGTPENRVEAVIFPKGKEKNDVKKP